MKRGVWAVVVLLMVSAFGVMAEEPVSPPALWVDLPNAKAPVPGVLVGGQPTQEQLQQAADLGYKTVINLRGVAEHSEWDEEALVESLGMRFLSVPIEGKPGLTEDNARAFVEALEAAGPGPMLIHCGSGNRVGGIFALKAFFIEGKTPEESLALGEQFGMRESLAPTVEGILSPEKPRE